MPPTVHSTDTTQRPGPVGRRTGYAVGVAVNVLVLYLANVWPGWSVLPFFSAAFGDVLWLVNASLIAGIVTGILNFIFDRWWLKALGDLLTLAVGVASLVLIWQVFPFVFPAGGFDWELLTRILLALAVVGSGIGFIAQVVALVRGRPAG